MSSDNFTERVCKSNLSRQKVLSLWSGKPKHTTNNNLQILNTPIPTKYRGHTKPNTLLYQHRNKKYKPNTYNFIKVLNFKLWGYKLCILTLATTLRLVGNTTTPNSYYKKRGYFCGNTTLYKIITLL